ncbi:hypothetical protein [Treponema sp.]|uniref:hypothetical protein n=1 Tax=Treponema sp. TaxID=166 RepID=UPI00298E4670|nr:hypothetical protein [Treponema sp.]MCQ2240047.1 hypothetical protein [Treponema sp.]
MFHTNESKKGRGTLAVIDGKMMLHVSLSGKKILNLYVGKAEDAKNKEDTWLKPTKDKITYEDGLSETVYGFNIPVKKLDSEFDLALIGKKSIWYDHKVSVSDVQKKEKLGDGNHEVNIFLNGGTGRAGIKSPAVLSINGGKAKLKFVWTSKNYDYLIAGEKKYLNETPGEDSTFEIPVEDISKPVSVMADTTAMGTPHEIEYKIGILY